MDKNNQGTLGGFLSAHFFKVAGVLFTVLNLWLTTRLGTIDTQLKLHNMRLVGLENLRAEFISTDSFSFFKEQNQAAHSNTSNRLERIEGKLDKLIERN